MAKFFGQVGFARTVEKPVDSGVWVDEVFERDYYGDVSRVVRRWEADQQVNDNINVNNQISIVSDPFVNQNIPWIKYVRWNGAVWKVSSVEIQYPRLVLSIGGVYNGEQARSAENPCGCPWV